MNADSLLICEGSLKKNGLLVVNSSLVKENPKRSDLNIVKIDATIIAEKVGNAVFANMVALGALAKLTGAFSLNRIEETLRKFFPQDKHQFIPMNVQAIEAGVKAV